NLSQYGSGPDMAKENQAVTQAGKPFPPKTRAHVKSFTAKVELTPRLSVGTATPESIYEARFTGTILAVHPGKAAVQEAEKDGAKPADECQLEPPLPPQTISLADLEIKAGPDGKASEKVGLGDGKLVWRDKLSEKEPTELKVTYTAVGK